MVHFKNEHGKRKGPVSDPEEFKSIYIFANGVNEEWLTVYNRNRARLFPSNSTVIRG